MQESQSVASAKLVSSELPERPAGFLLSCTALLIDVALVFALYRTMVLDSIQLFLLQTAPLWVLDRYEFTIYHHFLCFILTQASYTLVFEQLKVFRTTPGKLICRLEVVDLCAKFISFRKTFCLVLCELFFMSLVSIVTFEIPVLVVRFCFYLFMIFTYEVILCLVKNYQNGLSVIWVVRCLLARILARPLLIFDIWFSPVIYKSGYGFFTNYCSLKIEKDLGFLLLSIRLGVIFIVLFIFCIPNFRRSSNCHSFLRTCYANQKTILGSIEMYELDHGNRLIIQGRDQLELLVENKYLLAFPFDPGSLRSKDSESPYASDEFGNLWCSNHGTVLDTCRGNSERCREVLDKGRRAKHIDKHRSYW